MTCTDITTWSMLIRAIARIGASDCNSIAVDISVFAGADLDCDREPILSLVAGAVVNNVIRVQPYGAVITLPECSVIEPLPTETLLTMCIANAEGGGYLLNVVEDLPAVDTNCDRDCSEEAIGTEAMIRSTFVQVSDQWMLRVHTVGNSDAIECDSIEMSDEHLVRSMLAPMADGGYAWRITVEVP